TETWGGTTCGYCAIGRDRAARAPTRIMTSAMTVEKTGRSMKKLNMVSRSLRVDGSLPESHRCFDGPNVRQVSHGPSAVHLLAAAVEEAAAASRVAATKIGLTGAPARILPMPSTTTRSPGFNPLSTTHSFPSR